ncbi:MAG: uroporphyrinogen-III synthase [Rhodospirillales bacterium]|nr:uroporphyrinogen-III synthase [Rhodospirillales bacterium]
MRLLITRPRQDAEPLAGLLREMGAQPSVEPLLFIDLEDGPDLDLDGVQALLVTSANGVRALAARTPNRTLPVLAVGDASARAAGEAGFTDVFSATGDVDGLARLAGDKLDAAAGSLLHAAGSHLAGDLAGLLEAGGYAYRREILYRARPAEALSEETQTVIREGQLDGILFFSPRTAATFVRLLGEAGLQDACGGLVAFCLSPAVAEQVAAVPWSGVRTAEKPEQQALLQDVMSSLE